MLANGNSKKLRRNGSVEIKLFRRTFQHNNLQLLRQYLFSFGRAVEPYKRDNKKRFRLFEH